MQLLQATTLLLATVVSTTYGQDTDGNRFADYIPGDQGLEEYTYSGENPNCHDLGYSYGWKMNGCQERSTAISYDSLELTGPLPDGCDPYSIGSFMLECEGNGGELIDAKITPGPGGAVVKMKGGNGGTIYRTLQEGVEYTLDVGQRKGISHIEFCFMCDSTPHVDPPDVIPPPTCPEGQELVLNHDAAQSLVELPVTVEIHNDDSHFDLVVCEPPYAPDTGGCIKIPAWCVDYSRGIGGTTYQMDIFSAFDPDVIALYGAGSQTSSAVDFPELLPNLGWLMNNIEVGDPYDDGQGCSGIISWNEYQVAMWYVVDDKQIGDSIHNYYNQGERQDCISQGLASMAMTQGNGWVPDCNKPGELVPLLFIADEGATITNQVLMGEVELHSIEGMCECTEPPPPDSDCALPVGAEKFSVVTQGNAAIGGHSVYTGLAIGGTFSDSTPNESGTVDGPSFIKTTSGTINFNFNAGVTYGDDASALVSGMWEKLELLAETATPSTDGQYRVFVEESDGTFSMDSFYQDGQGYDNGNTLVIFKSCGDITITKTNSGRQFGPTIVAPCAKVIVQGDAGFVDGSIYAKTVMTSGNHGQLQFHGATYKGPITCEVVTPSPSKAPTTDAPSKAPTTDAPTGAPVKAPTTDAPTGAPVKAPTTDAPTGSPTGAPIPDDVMTTTSPPGTKGDPHFKTHSGEMYDFHGGCDLVLMENPAFSNGLGMRVHIRTKINTWWSYVESAVVQIGDQTIEVTGGEHNNQWFRINGVLNEPLEEGVWTKIEFAGLALRHRQNGFIREAFIYLGNGERLRMSTYYDFVKVDFDKESDEHYEGSLGLLGRYPDGQRVGRDGVTVIEDPIAFGQEWQVTVDEPKLFSSYDAEWVVPAGQACAMPEETEAKVALRRRRLEEGMPVQEAEKACAHLKEFSDEFKACTFDVLATQDTKMAAVW